MDFIKLFNLPIDASAHGHQIDMMIYLIHLLMFVLFIGWAIYFVIVVWRFSSHRKQKASYHGAHSHASTVLEVTVAAIELVLLFGLSVPFWAKQINAFPNRPDKLVLRIVAEQFAWNIHYPGTDGVFGKVDNKFFDKQSNPLGLDPNDPRGKDDVVTINQLHLPIGRPAVIYLSSKDVIHCFSLPVMRVKQDVIPGMSIPVWFTPTKTGEWEIACAQLCGLGHYRMKGFLVVQSQEDFDKWLAEQSKASTDSDSGGDDFWN